MRSIPKKKKKIKICFGFSHIYLYLIPRQLNNTQIDTHFQTVLRKLCNNDTHLNNGFAGKKLFHVLN